MAYVTILDPIPWEAVGYSVVQTFTFYWLLLLGIKLAGRRVFGETGPQDLILLVVVAESTNLGLTHEAAGYWGAVASVLTIITTGAVVERVRPLRRWLESPAIELVRNGRPLPEVMDKYLVDEDDLCGAARQYGVEDFQAFRSMTLESDGSIQGVLKPDARPGGERVEKHPVES